jgi:hypothetical protein
MLLIGPGSPIASFGTALIAVFLLRAGKRGALFAAAAAGFAVDRLVFSPQIVDVG